MVAGHKLPSWYWGLFTANVAERTFKKRYEKGKCASFGKIYRERVLAKKPQQNNKAQVHQ